MPGSLILPNDSRSDLSALSSKSFDSKLSAKRVSFNKAVRVKQYPETDSNYTDHLTLPSNRFWFKVYRNRGESEPKNYFLSEPGWKEDEPSLAPIAEIDDQENESGNLKTIQEKLDRYHTIDDDSYFTYNSYKDFDNHPSEPPVDYFEDHCFERKNNPAWETQNHLHHTKPISNNFNNNSLLPETISSMVYSSMTPSYTRLPRMSTRKDLQSTDINIPRERRSRSHDEHCNERASQDFKKVDKSVSTEDLNSNFAPNRFYRPRRDIATQCYGTLSREKNKMKPNDSTSPLFTRSNLKPLLEDINRINNFKSSASKPYLSNQTAQLENKTLKKDSYLNDNHLSSKTTIRTNANPHNFRNLNSSFKKDEFSTRNYPEPSQALTETSMFKNFKSKASKPEVTNKDFRQSKTFLNSDKIKNPDVTREKLSSTVGFVRGHQIPLTEVNTNISRRVSGRSETSSKGVYGSPLHNNGRIFQSNGTSQAPNNKHLPSYSENIKRKNYSSKKYIPSYNSDSSMIDWSLSGFQLSPLTSVSDSECSAPPLLMYIPGVSYHDRPADEEDRFSAFSEMEEKKSYLRRRGSMPRNTKLKYNARK